MSATTLMMRTVLALLLGGSALAAQAGGSVGIGLRLGSVVPTAGAVGTVGVQVGSGHRGWRGHRGHRGHGGHWRLGWGASVLWVAPPLVWAATPWPDAPLAAPPTAPVSVMPTQPEPVIRPAQGQDAQQTEYDRQQCNRYATTQPAAMADAGVFHQTALACMEQRGYAVRELR